jgi:hypothetical protein
LGIPTGGGGTVYTVGGTVSGLTGTGLVIQDNGTDDLVVAANVNSFVFATALSNGAAYAATVKTPPAGQTCTITNSSGTVAGANVTNVAVACTTSITGVVHETSNISSPTTWTSDKIHIIDSSISVSSALTINPGTIIKFKSGGYINVSTGGTIIADGGTIATSIIFTSIKDDIHGGDTNLDAALTLPAAGDWHGVKLSASGSKFNYCEFYYGGCSNTAALEIYSSNGQSATITNSIFAHNGDTDKINAVPALDAGSGSAGTVITGNTFYDNKVPLRISKNFSIDDTNSFDNVVSAPTNSQPNKYNGIIVYGCGSVTSNINWSAAKAPFVIGNPIDACNYFNIDASASLTLGDNVVLKFFSGGNITVNGTLTADAASGNKIVFTSIKDDAHGGDTNKDGSATAAAAGDWQGITLRANGSKFNHSEFYYGGNSNTSPLKFYGSNGQSATITNSTFAHNSDTDKISAAPALDAGGGLATTVITGNTFYDNKVPLRISKTFSMDDSNSFDNVVSAPTNSQPNKYNGIIVYGCGSVTSAINWSAKKVPFVIGDPIDACNYFNIDGSASLTLGDNVVLKFFSGGIITLSAGGILTQGAGDWFTSINDDSHLGDTNGNNAITTSAKGDWTGIQYPVTAPGSAWVTDKRYADWSNILYATNTSHTP